MTICRPYFTVSRAFYGDRHQSTAESPQQSPNRRRAYPRPPALPARRLLEPKQSRFVQIGEIQTRLLEAHGKAVEALKAEFCARLETLADEAQQIYNAAPEAARLHPRRLPDRNLEIGVERERGVELAAAFGMTLGYVFWHALTPEAYEGIVAKQRIGRSAPHESWTRDRTDPFAAHDPESRMGMT